MNVYPFIEAEKADSRNVARACELLQVSRSAYYQQRDQSTSARDASDAELTVHIHQIHAESKGRYGAPRIHATLLRQGLRVRPETGGPADAGRWAARQDAETVAQDDGARPGRDGAAGPGPP